LACRYKAKSFIGPVVYRPGDQLGAWSFAALGAVGLGLNQVAVVAAVVSGCWLASSW
jgi:AAA family ATP:ADP antiporter